MKTPLSKPKLFAGSLGCGNDLVKTRVIAQIIPARIQEEIAVCWRSERSWDCRNFFELLERAVALACPCVNQRQIGNPLWTVEGVLSNRLELDRAARLADSFLFSAKPGVKDRKSVV